MKKLFLILAFTLTTLFSFAQDKPFYMRAETFELGSKDSSGNIVWDESTIKSCDILIKLENKEAVIYSNARQIYHVISYEGKEDGISKWYCSDDKGRYCNIYLSDSKNNPGKLALIVEFSDYLWGYICKPTNY
jgi:hypothetical protein